MKRKAPTPVEELRPAPYPTQREHLRAQVGHRGNGGKRRKVSMEIRPVSGARGSLNTSIGYIPRAPPPSYKPKRTRKRKQQSPDPPEASQTRRCRRACPADFARRFSSSSQSSDNCSTSFSRRPSLSYSRTSSDDARRDVESTDSYPTLSTSSSSSSLTSELLSSLTAGLDDSNVDAFSHTNSHSLPKSLSSTFVGSSASSPVSASSSSRDLTASASLASSAPDSLFSDQVQSEDDTPMMGSTSVGANMAMSSNSFAGQQRQSRCRSGHSRVSSASMSASSSAMVAKQSTSSHPLALQDPHMLHHHHHLHDQQHAAPLAADFTPKSMVRHRTGSKRPLIAHTGARASRHSSHAHRPVRSRTASSLSHFHGHIQSHSSSSVLGARSAPRRHTTSLSQQLDGDGVANMSLVPTVQSPPKSPSRVRRVRKPMTALSSAQLRIAKSVFPSASRSVSPEPQGVALTSCDHDLDTQALIRTEDIDRSKLKVKPDSELYDPAVLRNLVLLTQAACPLDVNELNLRRCAINGDANGIRDLLSNTGVNPNASDTGGWSALILASRYGFLEAVQVLLRHGADINQETNEGWTALMYAVYNKHAEIVRVLLQHDEPPRLQHGTKTNAGWTALMYATYIGSQEIMEILINAEPPAHILFETPKGASAITCARMKRRKELRNMLELKSVYQRKDLVVRAIDDTFGHWVPLDLTKLIAEFTAWY